MIWTFGSDDAAAAILERHKCVAALRSHVGASAAELFALDQIYGELVSNVVRHAPGKIAITLELDRASAVLVVSDSGGGPIPEPSLPADPLSESGRGLFIVAHFAPGIVTKRNPSGGTSVCAVIPLTCVA